MTKHISHLSIKGYLGIEDLSVECGKVVKIEGRNGVGKSTLIQAIEMAFTNKGRRTKQVRDNADKGILLVNLDDGTEIKRTITETNRTVEVRKDGFKASKPQNFLDQLAGAFAFNPIDFISQKPEKQKETLLSILDIRVTPEDAERLLGSVPIGINWNLHGLQIQSLIEKIAYDTRTQKNAEKRALENQLKVEQAKLPKGFDPVPYRNVSLREKYDELRKAQEHNALEDDIRDTIQEATSKIANYKHDNEKYQLRIEDLKRQIADFEAKMTSNNEQIAFEEDWISTLQGKLETFQPIDTSALEKEIESFQEMQALVTIYDRVQEIKEKVAEAQKVAKTWDAKVEKIRKLPTELMKSVKLPVDGLGYDGTNFTYGGRPIDNLSDSEMIRFSLDIARSLAKDLKVICIDRLEALDDDWKAELYKQMEVDDFQYFVTERTSGDLKVRTLFDSPGAV